MSLPHLPTCSLSARAKAGLLLIARSVLHRSPVFGTNTRNGWVSDHSAIQKLHDVKLAANHISVAAIAVGLRYWHIGLFQSMYDLVFSVYSVCRFGEQFPRGLLAHHIFGSGRRCDLVGGVGLTKAKLQELAIGKAPSKRTHLLDAYRRLDLWYVLFKVLFEGLQIDRLSHWTRHDCALGVRKVL